MRDNRERLFELMIKIDDTFKLNESVNSQNMGISILNKNGVNNPQNIVKAFNDGDRSENQKNIPLMAFVYGVWKFTDINTIINDLNQYDALVRKNRIKPAQIVKNTIVMGNNTFTDYIKFSEYIHGETQKYSEKPASVNVEEFKSQKKPIWSGNGIDIYEGDEVGKCIAYTMGGLTNRSYSFCIGQPANTMYQSYRDSKDSSFYFIIDKNHFKKNEDGSVNLDDPLHIVVFDVTKHGIELTDSNNTTGTIAEFGSNTDGYVNYLKSKGVPVERLANRPKTPEEEKEQALLGKENHDLNWFIKLPYEYKSKYIGRGHLLTDEQFDYLMGNENEQ